MILSRGASFAAELWSSVREGKNVFDMLADGARLRAKNHADLVVAFALRNPDQPMSFLAVLAFQAQTTNRRTSKNKKLDTMTADYVKTTPITSSDVSTHLRPG